MLHDLELLMPLHEGGILRNLYLGDAGSNIYWIEYENTNDMLSFNTPV
jgi:hypothetical protein